MSLNVAAVGLSGDSVDREAESAVVRAVRTQQVLDKSPDVHRTNLIEKDKLVIYYSRCPCAHGAWCPPNIGARLRPASSASIAQSMTQRAAFPMSFTSRPVEPVDRVG